LTKKANLGNYYRHYSSATLSQLRTQYRKDLGKALGSIENPTAEQREVISSIMDSYGDMERELSDAIGTKADPFKLRRKGTATLEKHDYLPNLIDYINVKTIIGQKGIIQARAKLEMSQPEFFQNKDLIQQFQEITDYTLNSKDSEWSLARKTVYNLFLGFSVRHLLQNITQPFIIGLPELSSQLGSVTEASSRLGKAYKQVNSWNRNGTTGDAQLDKLLKQAEDEMLWEPSMLQHYVPGDELEYAGQASNAFLKGHKALGKPIKMGAAKASKAIQSGLQATASASEIFNRQVSFTMRVNEDAKNAKSLADLEKLYTEGSRFTNDVNFVGDKSNRPGFIRRAGSFHGPVLFATSLMSFVINHLSLLSAYKGQLVKGSVDWKTYKTNPDKFKLNNPGTYGLMTAAAMLMAFSGAMGMPFTQDADEIFEQIFGIRLSDAVRSKIIDLGEAFGMGEDEGDMVADAAMTGLPGAMGIGLSQSVGLGRIFSYQTGRPFTFWDALGAGGAVIERAGKAANVLSEDPTNAENWQRALRRSGPAGWQYWHELAHVVKDNKQLDTEGRIVSNELDEGANISRLLGFTPSEVTQSRGSEFRLKREQDRYNRERVKASDAIGRLLHEYNTTKNKNKLLLAQQEFRKVVQKRKMTVAQRQSLLKSISDDVFSRSDQTMILPSPAIGELLAKVQESNPDYQPTVVSKLKEKQGQIKVSSQLGDPLTLKLLQMSKSSRNRYLFYEALVARGVPPTQAWIIAGGKAEDMSNMQGYESPQLRFLGAGQK
jgi:hypothetical protein